MFIVTEGLYIAFILLHKQCNCGDIFAASVNLGVLLDKRTANALIRLRCYNTFYFLEENCEDLGQSGRMSSTLIIMGGSAV